MSRDPVPEEPIEGIVRAFERAPLVALGEAHGVREQADLIGQLLGAPSFSDHVDTVVVEFGNALYQPEIDRYTAGEYVDRDGLQSVWREVIGGIHSRVFESPIYERFFTTVREYNRGRSPGRRLRVLLGDPPFDRGRSRVMSGCGPSSNNGTSTSPRWFNERCSPAAVVPCSSPEPDTSRASRTFRPLDATSFRSLKNTIRDRPW